MNKRIKIHVRSLKAPDYDSPSMKQNYDAGLSVWASVFTLGFQGAGQKLFDDVDVGDQPTNKFVIRYRPNITKENVVSWRGNYYKLVKCIDPEERNEWWELFGKLLGDKTKKANT